jgi:glutamate carboxypeptidase
MTSLLSFTESQRGWLLDAVKTLVSLESPSTDKAAVDRCGEALAERLAALGARVQPVVQRERGNHLRAEFDGEGDPILLLGHFDTVWSVGELERMPVRESDGRLFGPGVFDMKAGIGVAMLALRALRERAHGAAIPKVVMLWTSDEEVGSATSRAIIEAEALRSRAVLVLEPSLPGGAVKTRRKGCGDFVLTVHGVSAHAGIDPGRGANAVHELARQIVAIESLQDLERGVSVNVNIVAGGSRSNVIPDYAQATIDVRAPGAADAQRIQKALAGLSAGIRGTRLELSGGFGRPPLERTAGVVRLYEKAKVVAAGLGRDLAEGGTGGGSDGNFTAALGVPTLDGLGPQGDGAHARHEHVVIADLPWRAAFLAALLADLGKDNEGKIAP